MFDVFDDIFNDMSNNIWWNLKKADIFDDKYDAVFDVFDLFDVFDDI